MTELQELYAQRNAIDKKIRELQNETLECGRVKYEKKRYSTFYSYQISIHTYSDTIGDRWHRYIEVRNPGRILILLKVIIDDLTAMYNNLVERWEEKNG